MKLPFPTWTLNSIITVYKHTQTVQGESDNQEVFNGRANHVKQSKQVLNAKRELVLISGWIVVPGDIENIALDDALIVKVDEIERRVFSVNKPANPDGSTYATELYLV